MYRSLDRIAHLSLDVALDRIANDPQPDGDRIISHDVPPGVIYIYEDDDWKISYGLSYSRTDQCYDIEVFAIVAK